jgi:predicted cupin superfamily sugar epimerase
MLQLGESGTLFVLGSDVLAGQLPQVVVPAGVWQGSKLRPGGTFALLGTTMTPGFDFADYVPGQKEPLKTAFPAWSDWIDQLCR